MQGTIQPKPVHGALVEQSPEARWQRCWQVITDTDGAAKTLAAVLLGRNHPVTKARHTLTLARDVDGVGRRAVRGTVRYVELHTLAQSRDAPKRIARETKAHQA